MALTAEACDEELSLRDRVPGGVGGWLDDEEDGWRDEVGESYYLDMLRDDTRNKAYRDGLERAIAGINTRQGSSSVLDIGTGSGLLAMMAQRAGSRTHINLQIRARLLVLLYEHAQGLSHSHV